MENRRADELIRRIGHGDMQALEELYKDLSRAVYGFVFSIVKNRTAAEDIMQDTFVRVYNAASAFRASGSGVSWVMRIAHNLSINAVKKKSTEEFADLQKTAEDTANTAIDRTLINSALEKLSETERKIVVLHAVSGLTLSEIALVLDEPLGTVKWRHAAALGKMRKILKESEVDE